MATDDRKEYYRKYYKDNKASITDKQKERRGTCSICGKDTCLKKCVRCHKCAMESNETRSKMSNAKIGKTPWNKGLNIPYKAHSSMLGHIAWNKGIEIQTNTGRTHFKKGEESPNKGKQILSTHGELHWNWKGGLGGENYIERRKFQSQVQKKVFERDNYKCVFCGNGGDLQVDHIQSWSKYVELRFDINNCRTLCASCHYKITFGKEMPHHIKGWGHNFLRRVQK